MVGNIIILAVSLIVIALSVYSIRKDILKAKTVWAFMKEHSNYSKSLRYFYLMRYKNPFYSVFVCKYKDTLINSKTKKAVVGDIIVGVIVTRPGRVVTKVKHLVFFLNPMGQELFTLAINHVETLAFMLYPNSVVLFNVQRNNNEVIKRLLALGYDIDITSVHKENLVLTKSKRTSNYGKN